MMSRRLKHDEGEAATFSNVEEEARVKMLMQHKTRRVLNSSTLLSKSKPFASSSSAALAILKWRPGGQ